MRDDTAVNTQNRKIIGRWISLAIVVSAFVVGCFVLYRTNYYPRTDDAEIFANFIGIAPQVDGPLARLNVKDNQAVKTGDLLYEIDERPYEYALENALAEQAALEGQIADEQRRIAALVSAVSVAQENIHSAEAEVTDAERGVGRARAPNGRMRTTTCIDLSHCLRSSLSPWTRWTKPGVPKQQWRRL
jgi:membrane fusion protein, multidrug efflux system